MITALEPASFEDYSELDGVGRQLDSLLANLASLGHDPMLSLKSYARILRSEFRGDSTILAAIACGIALREQPLTLRGLFYRIVSTGALDSTSKPNYDKVGRLVTRLRRLGLIDYRWIVDSLRETVKPSSWSGLEDFSETVRHAYRKDFWSHLPSYVHIFVEKDAIAGAIEPITRDYDVRLSPVRGYCSESFAFATSELWRKIDKPIYAAYLGDRDPSGMDIERDLRKKLREMSGREFDWKRLSVVDADFEEFDLIKLAPKTKDNRYQKFTEKHGDACAEVDAVPATELRRRVEEFILGHVDADEWNRLLVIESIERDTFNSTLATLRTEATS